MERIDSWLRDRPHAFGAGRALLCLAGASLARLLVPWAAHVGWLPILAASALFGALSWRGASRRVAQRRRDAEGRGDGIDDRELRVGIFDLDGNKLTGEEFLRIRRLVRASNAHTIKEIDAVIHAELAKRRVARSTAQEADRG